MPPGVCVPPRRLTHQIRHVSDKGLAQGTLRRAKLSVNAVNGIYGAYFWLWRARDPVGVAGNRKGAQGMAQGCAFCKLQREPSSECSTCANIDA